MMFSIYKWTLLLLLICCYPGAENGHEAIQEPEDGAIWNESKEVLLHFELLTMFETKTIPSVALATTARERDLDAWKAEWPEKRTTALVSVAEMDRIHNLLNDRGCLILSGSPAYRYGSGVVLRYEIRGTHFFTVIGHDRCSIKLFDSLRHCLNAQNRWAISRLSNLVRSRIENQTGDVNGTGGRKRRGT